MNKVNKPDFSKFWACYKRHVYAVVLNTSGTDYEVANKWSNAVFCQILTYVTPVSFFALIPSMYLSFVYGVREIGSFDIYFFVILAVITMVPDIKLKHRKVIFIFTFYSLSVTMLYLIPRASTGLLFLVVTTIFSALIFSRAAAYKIVGANTVICLSIALLIYFKIKIPIATEYSVGVWIAVALNLVVVSFACVKFLDFIMAALISEVKNNTLSETKREKENRLQHFISEINQTIVYAKNADTLFENFCSIAREHGQYKVAWIGTFDTEQKNRVLLDSWGLPKDEINTFLVPYESAISDNLFQTGKYIVWNDTNPLQENQSWKRYTETYAIASALTLPIKKAGSVFGTINLYSKESNYFDEHHILALSKIVDSISFALNNFERAIRFKNNSEMLLAREKRFRTLIENSSDMIILSSLEGKIIYSSPAVTMFTGYSNKEILNRSVYDFIHREEIAQLVENIHQLLESPGKSFVNTHRILQKNRGSIWCEGTYTNMLDVKGIEGLVFNFRANYKREESEWQLQESYADLNVFSKEQSTILNTLPESIALLDNEGNILEINNEWINFGRANGMPESYQQLGKNYIEISENATGKEANDGKQMSKGLKEVLQGERECFMMEYPCDSPTEKRWFKAEVRPYNVGQRSGAVVMHFDISEQKKTETEMLLLINNTEESFILLDTNLQIVSFNNLFQNLIEQYGGLQIQKGHHIYEYIPEEKVEVLADIYSRVLDGVAEKLELTFQGEDNSPIHFCVKHSPAVDPAGNIIGVFVTVFDITEKRRAAEQKEFERKNKEALINSTDDLIWSITKDFKFLAANKSFINELKKFTPDKIMQGDNVLDQKVFAPEYINHWKALYNRAFAGESFKIEIYTPAAPGRPESWTETSFSPIFVKQEITGVACYSRNITERKKSELELRASETRLAEAQSLAKIGNWETDLLTLEVLWSEQTYEIFDCQPEDIKLSHLNFLTIVHPDDREKVDVAFKNSIDEAVVHSIEHRIITQKGAIKFVEERWQLFHDSKGIPIKVVGTCQDITERKLSDYQNKFKAELLDTIGQAVIATDLRGKVTFWNQAAFQIYGWTSKEALGKNIWELTPTLQTKAEANAVIRTLVKGGLWSGEFYVRRKTGSYFLAFVYKSPVFDEFGKRIGVISISNDISERKENEMERAKIASDLLQRNRDLEQFTFIISHNLRAPLANIIGFTEVLQEETITQTEQNILLDALASSVSGLDAIIRDISSILQVKREINDKKESVSLSSLVNDILVYIENNIDIHQVQMKVDFTEIDEMFTIKAYMHSIFYNLINNSIKYSKPEEQTVIEIKSKIEKGKIVLTFKDNGIGIDMKTKGDKVFGLYKRFHSHTEGKGIGLFMVKTQVEAIGGIITVTSEVNIGTEFTIIFDYLNSEA